MRTPAEPNHILACLPNWLGDVVMCTPALRALRSRHPNAHITLAGNRASIEMLDGLPYANAAITLPPRAGWADFRRAAAALPARPDLGIAFPHSTRAALLLLATGCRARLGYNRGGRSLLLTHRVEPHRESGSIAPIYMAREYLSLLAPLGCADDHAGLALHAPAQARTELRARLDPARPVVGIAPGAAFGPSKRWLPERFAAVADALHESSNAQCLLFTGPGEEDTRDAVLAAARHPLLDVQQPAPSVAKLKAGIAELDLLIGNDSAPRHIAIAFGVPVICIMGPTAPAYTTSPYERGEVIRVDVDCGPCQKPTCVTDHRCMKQITVAHVVDAARQFL
jgi:heptosyltransferase-2